MTTAWELYEELLQESKKIALLRSVSAVLEWDEQTYMPDGGSEHRADQLEILAGLAHERMTSPRQGELLQQLEEADDFGDEDGPMAVNIRELRRDYDRAVKLPRRLVEELSRTTCLSQQAWREARKQQDFDRFLPWLGQIVALKREQASALGYDGGIPYDALLDDHEPGMTSEDVTSLFEPLKSELVDLVSAIGESSRRPDASILTREYPVAAQRRFALAAARGIGFDFDRGRLDETTHPFCSGFGPGDCRLTTRYDARHFPGAFFGTLHETGHGLYEQGLDGAAFGTPIGEAVSLGIHESQSRLWENFVARSKAFWEFWYPQALEHFGETLADVSLDDFHFAVNEVRPSWIRVEADEVTYNLHIMLRFELERPLISGELDPRDVPAAWNETFEQFFGMTPPDDSLGCLQDIHWSAGLIGYFPTYTLGNMCAAQFYQKAEQDLGNLDEQFARGEFAPLLSWLRENIHCRGKQYRSRELVERVTGTSLSHTALTSWLREKYSPLYGL